MLPLRWGEGGGGCPKLYSDRKAREAHLIDKTMTLEPHGISRRANSVSDIFLFSSISFSICSVFKSRIYVTFIFYLY